jgi:transposase-like protein
MKSKNRRFSAAFKKEKVELIDQEKISVREVSEIYEVSVTAVYKWIKKYSSIARDERVVVEKVSESNKNIELLKRIRDLERTVGQKQIELDYYKAIVDVVSQESGEDIKKKYKPK